MTLEEIKDRIDKMFAEAANSDFEAAHGTEDQLYHDFIVYVSTKPDDPELHSKARLVSRTKRIGFPRYCA